MIEISPESPIAIFDLGAVVAQKKTLTIVLYCNYCNYCIVLYLLYLLQLLYLL
jgi:hypothetical protein